MNHYLFWFIFIDMININTYLNENPTQTQTHTQPKPIPNPNPNLNRIMILRSNICKYYTNYRFMTYSITSNLSVDRNVHC